MNSVLRFDYDLNTIEMKFDEGTSRLLLGSLFFQVSRSLNLNSDTSSRTEYHSFYLARLEA